MADHCHNAVGDQPGVSFMFIHESPSPSSHVRVLTAIGVRIYIIKWKHAMAVGL